MSRLNSVTAGVADAQQPTAVAMVDSNTSGTQPFEYQKGLPLAATLFSLAIGTFLMALDTTIITVAVPEITTHFNALDQVGWVGSAYLITLTAFQPISGSVYKTFDPKTLYIGFILLFEGMR